MIRKGMKKEIESLITMANAGLVDIAAVGNEVLHREKFQNRTTAIY
jgi:hypothetical protein